MKAKISKSRGAKSSAAGRGDSGRPGGQSSASAHVTPADGNVFVDLGFCEPEAENLKVRARLMRELRDVIAGVTQVEAAQLLGVTQPRVSDLKRGKIGLFTIDALVNMLAHAGLRIRVSLSRPEIARSNLNVDLEVVQRQIVEQMQVPGLETVHTEDDLLDAGVRAANRTPVSGGTSRRRPGRRPPTRG